MVGPPPDTWEVEASAASAQAVVDGLWRLRLPTPWPQISHANAYAIDHAEGGIVLVDAGCGGHPSAIEALRKALADAGHTTADVRDLVITHFHSDHIGTVARLALESGCTVWAHPAAEHFMGVWRSPGRYRAERERFAHRLGVPPELVADVANVREEADGIDGDFEVHRTLVAGLAVPTALGDWEVIETPGHAPSQVCLFLGERRLLVVGDLVGPVLAPFFDLGFSADPVGQHLIALRAAQARRAALILPGHGRPIAEVDPLFERNVDGLTDRIDAVEAAVAGEPGTAFELFVRRFGDQHEPVERVWRLWELAGYLDHLVQTGRVDHTNAENGAVVYSAAQR